jgi:hypothetical protein
MLAVGVANTREIVMARLVRAIHACPGESRGLPFLNLRQRRGRPE